MPWTAEGEKSARLKAAFVAAATEMLPCWREGQTDEPLNVHVSQQLLKGKKNMDAMQSESNICVF